MEIRQIADNREKKIVTRLVLEALPEWFGIPEAREHGYSFLQVKTVQMGKYAEYDETNMFYRSLGFKEFEVFPTLWNEKNPCQIYVMSLR